MDQNQPNAQPVAPQAQVPPAQSQAASAEAQKGRSAMGIVSLVLGIIAICISFIPIVNNFAALLALVGLVFGIVGVIQTGKGKRAGRGMSIAALIINILAFIIVMTTQAMFSAAFDAALSTNSPSQTVAVDGSTSTQEEGGDAGFEDLSLGTAVELNNGLTVSVDAVQAGLKNYDGSEITGITVSYTNNGTSSQSFNVYDWKAEDAQGAQRSTTYYSEATDELNSGSLAAGGSVTGSIYFEGTPAKAVYEQMISFDDTVVSWNLA